MLCMHLCGMTSFEDDPCGFPSRGTASEKKQFVHKLALRLVDVVFLTPSGLDKVIRASGECTRPVNYCVCDGGSCYYNSVNVTPLHGVK